MTMTTYMEKSMELLTDGKDPYITSNYSPISLACRMGKIFERMVNYRFIWVLEPQELISKHQIGSKQSYQ